MVFPPVCPFCSLEFQPAGFTPELCPNCVARLVLDNVVFCPRCGNRRPAGAGAAPDCPRCRGQRLPVDAVVPLGLYQAEMRRAVVRMKQLREQALAAAVGGLMAQRLGPGLAARSPDLATAVPKHWLRRLRLGTNSAEILMESLAERLGLPACGDLLRCRRKTKKQGMLAVGERALNVRGAFHVAAGYDLRGTHVLLIDDILTSGATASEVARVLKKAGAVRVTVAVAARAVAR